MYHFCLLPQTSAHVSVSNLVKQLKWTQDRAQAALVFADIFISINSLVCVGGKECILLTLDCLIFFYFQTYMLDQGLVWIDNQAPNEPDYWFPSLFVAPSPSIASSSLKSTAASSDSNQLLEDEVMEAELAELNLQLVAEDAKFADQ